jgi:hypothetical protein
VAFLLGVIMEERRQCGRWQVNNLASVKLEGRDTPLVCKIEELGFKGLRIKSPQELKKDSILALSIALDNEVSLNIEAAVVWSNTQGTDNICGLCFTKIKDKDRGHIYRYVHRNCREQLKQQMWQGVM